jgi:formylmethanofuran dehydrogenase subunit D
MVDEPTFEQMGEDKDVVGETTTRKVQELNRVSIDEDFLDQIGVKSGDKVFVVCKEDSVEIMKADASKLINNA